MTHRPIFVPGRSGVAPGHTFRRRIGLLPLVMVMFFGVSGGAFGLEEAVGESGAGMTLLLLLLVPLIWSIPAALMVAELGSALPAEGGYYAWVKKALGPFWGFQEGWWSWINSFVDMAIYPVLFVQYLSYLIERHVDSTVLDDHSAVAFAVKLVVIWGCTYLNLRGIRPVGQAVLVLGVLVLTPFGVLILLGLRDLLGGAGPVWSPVVPEGTATLDAFGLGLFIVLWNYLGWDGVTTVEGEIETPRRNVPRALGIAVPLVILAYVLPVLAGLTATTDPGDWTEGSFPTIAALVGGAWLGTWLAIAGLLSAVGLFSALLLANSRLPYVLAADGYLPRPLGRLNRRFESPWGALIISSVIYSLFSLETFANLVVVDVILYAAALILEFAALIVLRLRQPTMERPYRVPGGWPGVILISLSPVLILVLAVAGTVRDEGASALYLSLAALATGPLLYPVLRVFVKRQTPDVEVA